MYRVDTEKMLLFRRRKGLTQNQVAELAEIHPITYNRIELGKIKDPGAMTVASIATVLGLTVMDLLIEAEEQEKEKPCE